MNEVNTGLGEEIYEELIAITEQKKALEAREKELKETINTNRVGDVKFWERNITKVLVHKVALKEWVTAIDIKTKFGDEYLKYDVDMDMLKKNPDAHDVLEIKPSSYLKVSKEKTLQETFDEI